MGLFPRRYPDWFIRFCRAHRHDQPHTHRESSGITRNSRPPGQISKSSPPSPFPTLSPHSTPFPLPPLRERHTDHATQSVTTGRIYRVPTSPCMRCSLKYLQHILSYDRVLCCQQNLIKCDRVVKANAYDRCDNTFFILVFYCLVYDCPASNKQNCGL